MRAMFIGSVYLLHLGQGELFNPLIDGTVPYNFGNKRLTFWKTDTQPYHP